MRSRFNIAMPDLRLQLEKLTKHMEGPQTTELPLAYPTVTTCYYTVETPDFFDYTAYDCPWLRLQAPSPWKRRWLFV